MSSASDPHYNYKDGDNEPNKYQMDIFSLVKDPANLVIKREG